MSYDESKTRGRTHRESMRRFISSHCIRDKASRIRSLREYFPEVYLSYPNLRNAEANSSIRRTGFWPTHLGKGVIPNFPDFHEYHVFGKRDKSIDYYSGKRCRVTWSYLKENPSVLKKIVSKNILGLRFDIPIPKKYQGYFRYCGKFNFLTVLYNHPIGLTSFLLRRWRVEPYKCFLVSPVGFKNFLKSVPESWIPSGYDDHSVSEDSDPSQTSEDSLERGLRERIAFSFTEFD